jgi:hypothetical protein
MFLSVKKQMLGAVTDYDQRPRRKWILSHPSQVFSHTIYSKCYTSKHALHMII